MTSIIPGRLAEYRKRLTDPGRRSTIPNAYLQKLNPQLYAKRQANVTNAARTAKNNALYDPLRQLSGSEIYSLAKAQAGTQYDPQINNAVTDRKLAIVNDAALAERIGGYNQMAASALATAHEQSQSGAAALAQQLSSTRTGTLGTLDADQAKAQQFAQDDASLRGGQDNSGGMATRLAADFAQQRQGVATTLAAQETAGNVQAQGWSGLLGMMQGAQAIQGQNNLTQIGISSANREAGLQQDISNLQGQKAGAVADNVEKLRGSEFEKGAAIQTLNLKGQAQALDEQKAASDQAYKAATLKANTAYRKATLDLQKLTAQQAHGDRSATLKQRIKEASAKQKDAASRLTLAQNKEARQREKSQHDMGVADQKLAQGGKDTVNGVKLRTPLQQSDFGSKVSHLVNGIVPELKSGRGIPNSNYDPKDKNSKKYIVPPKRGGYSRAEIGRLILRDPKSPEQLAVTVALDVAIDGHISPPTVAALHRAGIAVKNLPYKTRRMTGTDRYHDTSRSGGGA